MACFVQIFILYNTVKNFLPTYPETEEYIGNINIFLGLKRKTLYIHMYIMCAYFVYF